MVDDAAGRGYARGAGSYRRARPSYHPAIVDEVVNRASGALVVELGAGTGILTAELVARGLDVLAVEPVAAMRRVLTSEVGGATACDGTAEDVPVGDGTAGSVVAAQSFHWFDPGPALDEIARVLRPGGQLMTVWNVRDERVPWVAAYTDVVDRHAGGTPRSRTMSWRRAIESDGRFELVRELSVPNPQPADAETVVQRALSTSFIAALPDDEQAMVVERIRQVVAALGERFAYPYRSELQAWMRRARPDGP